MTAALLVGVSCGPPARYEFGFNLTGMLFAPVDPTEGIHPSVSVLSDPANPFVAHPLGAQTKWRLLEDGGSVAAFYAFATALAREPTGENQFYAARALAEVARTGSLVDPALREPVTLMAIAGFQAVLDAFPDARGYDATGSTSFRLATPAYHAIEELGGKVQGDWVLVTTKDGEQAVRASEVAGAQNP